MKVIQTNEKAYPVRIEDSWGGMVHLTPDDVPFVLEELKKILDK